MVGDGDAPTGDIARRRAVMPDGTREILDFRSLGADQRQLAALLRPGLAVLDVGCGTGAITRGIAEAVGPDGRAVGVDVNPSMIEAARAAHRRVPGLSFYVVDVYALPFRGEFDIIAAARVLQWLADPEAALSGMMKGLRRGGRIVVLDYNHQKASWTPEPPASMRRFVEAFLRWRAAAGLDNAIADRLEKLLAAAGLTAVTSTDQSEITRRGDQDFETRAGIWATVAATRGYQMVTDGAISESARRAAEIEYRAWLGEAAQSHAQYLRAAEGVRP